MGPSRLLPLLVLAAGCAAPTGGQLPARAPDWNPAQVRQVAVLVHVTFAADAADAERAALARAYEGALLDALDRRAVPVRDVRVAGEGGPAPTAAQALGRAREVGADHALLVSLRIARTRGVYCRGERRPFSMPATVWAQALEVLRVSDGARRLAVPAGPATTVTDFEADCAEPRQSRRRTPDEMAASAAARLVGRLLSR